MSKMKDIFSGMGEKLQFLKPSEDQELEGELQIEEDDLDTEEGDLEIEEETVEEVEKTPKVRSIFADQYSRTVLRRILLAGLIAVIAFGFLLYNKMHTFTDYVITKSYENEVASGTNYALAGKYIYRYNSDGVSCVTRKNQVKWSITYNMQAPIADVCGDTMVIAEQQGNQIYVVNADGLMGNFETVLPILKVRVSKQGVVAAVLQEDSVTWVNMYSCTGDPIVNDKTTLSEFGYPLDVDVSPNGEKLVVSYLNVKEGIVSSNLVFYHFGKAGEALKNHIALDMKYKEEVIPEVFFMDNSTLTAVSDKGYYVFRGSDVPEQDVAVSFEEEIMSSFHEDKQIGFLFRSEEEGYNYRMELYNFRGKRKAVRNIHASFDKIKMQNGQILMYSNDGCEIFTSSCRKRFSSPYEKNLVDIFYFSEFRKYLVITDDSFDRIRIGD